MNLFGDKMMRKRKKQNDFTVGGIKLFYLSLNWIELEEKTILFYAQLIYQFSSSCLFHLMIKYYLISKAKINKQYEFDNDNYNEEREKKWVNSA